MHFSKIVTVVAAGLSVINPHFALAGGKGRGRGRGKGRGKVKADGMCTAGVPGIPTGDVYCPTSCGVCGDADDVIAVDPDVIAGDPDMKGLRGQMIDWSGVDGGWYSLIKDDDAEVYINVRLTAPLPHDFPDRQLITGLSVLSEGHSLVIEVEHPYTIDTDGCPEDVSPCLANCGLRMVVDGQKADELLRFSSKVPVADGAISVSASNLPVECRQFGGDKIWARQYEKMMLEGRRQLFDDESLEDWILKFDNTMAAPGWCAKYIVGWNGRVLPDLEFWQMDVGLDGLDVEKPALSGILGETARPVYDGSGKEVMEGFEAFRGTVEDYRVSGALGVRFALLDYYEDEGHH
eukprot:g9654.t1